MGVAALVLAGVLIGGALSAPTSKATPPELLPQPTAQNAAPVTYISRHHAQDELGQVNYGFSHPGQAKNELRDSSGNVAGSYSYIDADNKLVVVEYTAGENGVQVTSNNLPVAVSDTSEVLAAKLQFVEQYNAAAIAAANAADDVESNDNPESPTLDSGSTNLAVPIQVSPSPVRDTPEVIAAKLQFVEAYNAAALAAANAPDYDDVANKDTTFKSEGSVNPNPIKDTPEVVAAKLQFVEAYNAAALDAVKQAGNPQADSSSKVAIVYGIPVVHDTPEVLAAKLKFVEEYNAAAKAAALAPDDNVHKTVIKEDLSITDNSSDEPTTELGILARQTLETTLSPRDEEESSEPTTILPFPSEKDKEANKKFYPLIPTKVETSEEKSKHSDSVVEHSIDANDSPLYKFTYSNTGMFAPQAYSYGVGVAHKPLSAEAPSAKTSMLPKPVVHPLLDEQAIAVPVTYVTRHHAQDELGQVNYGYSYPGQAQNELRYANGHVAGVYSYVDDENKLIHVEYTAGKDGFQVTSNNLPIAVQDTPEVLAAKLQFVEAYNAAALAAANAPDDPVDYSLYDEESSAVFLANQNPVRDTPEVLAAKLQFVEAYNAAALAAANAPDDPEESTSPEEDNAEVTFANPNLVSDTPEVTAAKIQFVEAYNAAALAAAGATNEPGQEEDSKATLAYAYHPVKDTPEVIAAKIQFVEAYNAAALAAALAPDDEPQENPEEIGEVERYAAEEAVPVEEDSSVVVPLVPSTSLQVPAVPVPVTYVSRHHAQDELGQVNYGFSYSNEAKNEVRDADGNVAGAYSYVDSENKVIHVKYTAGEDGFQVVSNNLPVAPNDTPEVLAAKLQFVEAYNAAALAAAAAPDDAEVEGFPISDASFIVPTPVHDTPEVLAAKLQFVEAYNAAALAAANAPDDPSEEHTTYEKLIGSDAVGYIPEVTEAKLNFVEAYNAATIVAASTGDSSELVTKIAHAPHPVQDTPEVIAAKIAFVEAYNAAALAAAAAPDEPGDAETATTLEERNSEEPIVDMIIETNNLQNLVASDLPEVSQPLDDLSKTSEITESSKPVTSLQYHAFLSPFSRYAGYLPKSDGTFPVMYTYSVPYGLYGFPSSTSLKDFPIPVHFAPTQSIQQDLNPNNNHVIMYAPFHGY